MSTLFTKDRKASATTQSSEQQANLKHRRVSDDRRRRLHEQFEAHLRLDGRLVCLSRQPFLDGARASLETGEGRSTVLVIFHAFNRSMKSPIGLAAALGVAGTRFVRRKVSRASASLAGAFCGSRRTQQPKLQCDALGASDNVEAVEAQTSRNGSRPPAQLLKMPDLPAVGMS